MKPHPTCGRRRLLRAPVALAALSSLGAPQLLRAATELSLGYPLPLNSQFGAGATGFSDELARLSGGRLIAKHFPASALGGERNMIEAIQLGAQHLALVSTGAIGGFVPEATIFDLPFLFRDYAHAHATLDGEIGAAMLKRFDARQLVALAWAEGGFRHLTNNKLPIRSPNDLRGLKIRTQENPIHIATFRGLGANPTPIAWPETFTALQQNAVDGQDNPVSVIESAKLFQVQKYLSMTRHLYTPAIFLAAPKLMSSLSAEDRGAFFAAARVGAAAMRKRSAEDEASGVQKLRAAGMEVVESVDAAPFVAALASTYDGFAKQFGADQIARIRQVR